MISVLISDEEIGGKINHSLTIELNKITSIKEIIEARVMQEVNTYNNKANEILFKGLITPTKKEQVLNPFKKGKKKDFIDAEKQIYIALDAFQKNGFFVLVDNEQVETLEQKITVKETTKINFIKLTPLVGG